MPRAGDAGGGAQPLPRPGRAVTVISILRWKSSSERHSSWSTVTQLVHGRARTHIHISNSKSPKRGLRPCFPCHPDSKWGNAWGRRRLTRQTPGSIFTVSMGTSSQRGQGLPRSHSGTLPSPQGLPVLTARLGQCPHFVHVWLAVRAVYLHHDKVLVCACLVWAARRGGWREAAPSQRGL